MEESLSDVFWRLVGAGVPVVNIGADPDYMAAYEREHPKGHPCPGCIVRDLQA